MLDFRMETFLAVCRYMNFTRAAENMQYQMPETFKEVEQGISDGRYSIGVKAGSVKAILYHHR